MIKRPFDALPAATPEEVDAVLRPFIARFVPKARRERVESLFLPLRPRTRITAIVDAIDSAAMQWDGEIRFPDARQGVYLTGSTRAYRTTLGVALTLGGEGWEHENLFVAHTGEFGVIYHDEDGFCLVSSPRAPDRSRAAT